MIEKNKENIEISYNKKKFYIIFLGTLAVFTSYVSGFSGLISDILLIIVYSLIAYIIHIIWRLIRRKEKLEYNNFLDYFLYRISILLLIFFVLFGSFIYYENEISPTKMPTYTISNGKKTVIFQAMSHIGSEKFYNTVKNDLIVKKKEGYVYFYEGVKPGKKENHKKFNKAMGIKFDKDLYKNLSKIYGVIHQNNSIYMNLVNNKDFNVDLSLDEIMKYYEKSEIKEERKINLLQNDKVLDANKEILKALSSLNNRELTILRYINKGILNFMIGSNITQNFIMDNFSNKKLFDIILNKRNKVLANEIIKSEYNKIYITYGLLHFEGVLELLKKDDKNWKITNIKYMFPIK